MNTLIVSPSPHVHGKESTRKIMGDVIIALLPAVLVSIWFFGLSAIHLVCVSVLACVVFEYFIQKVLMKKRSTVGDLSAVVTGVLLALNLPVCSPWWLILIGAFVAIGIAKMSFGGLGQNLFNPALVARVVLLVSFPVLMTGTAFHAPETGYLFGNSDLASAALDATSGATPLGFVKEQLAKGVSMQEIMATPGLSYTQLLFANMGGSAGELSAVALILGFIYLLCRRVIKPWISLSILATVFVFAGILYLGDSSKYVDPVFHVLNGGLLLGAFFMATDYVTSPMTAKGQVIFGIGIGVITVLIRTFGAYPEGVSFAILIMNATVPLLNKFQPKRFAEEAQKK
ncbi:MAG: RnfABCDGE type electron transport complex subunit D [Bacteroidales bacterium]|nr:RnfABCDGE type electron transport complex subunit D [Bacteroidales bacterium]MBP5518187.1 RnfABCDGE type electron transport complex subunit D [Bacteroidales bacterium]